MDSRINPMNPNLVGDDSVDAEIAGEQEPLHRDEGGARLQASALDWADPETNPTEYLPRDPDLDNDPGQLAGSRDPDVADDVENDHRPEDIGGNTPYDAQGMSG